MGTAWHPGSCSGLRRAALPLYPRSPSHASTTHRARENQEEHLYYCTALPAVCVFMRVCVCVCVHACVCSTVLEELGGSLNCIMVSDKKATWMELVSTLC